MAETRLLMVEGKHDWHVFDHICYAHGIQVSTDNNLVEPSVIKIKAYDGIVALREALKVALKGSALTNIGVVVDADTLSDETGLSSRWCSIRDLFREAGYTCPDRPAPIGLVVSRISCRR